MRQRCLESIKKSSMGPFCEGYPTDNRLFLYINKDKIGRSPYVFLDLDARYVISIGWTTVLIRVHSSWPTICLDKDTSCSVSL